MPVVYVNKQFIAGYNSSGVTWQEAESLCESFGSQLVSINDNQTLIDAYNTLMDFGLVSLEIDEKQWFFHGSVSNHHIMMH